MLTGECDHGWQEQAGFSMTCMSTTSHRASGRICHPRVAAHLPLLGTPWGWLHPAPNSTPSEALPLNVCHPASPPNLTPPLCVSSDGLVCQLSLAVVSLCSAAPLFAPFGRVRDPQAPVSVHCCHLLALG
eukprot:1002839-Rhodomonas_salina.4